MRGENTPERKVASTGDQTHNHQVMSPTHFRTTTYEYAPEKGKKMYNAFLCPIYTNQVIQVLMDPLAQPICEGGGSWVRSPAATDQSLQN